MPRNITVTFSDGTSHVYQNAPDNITPDQVTARAQQEFGKQIAALDGGRGATPSQPRTTPSEVPGPRQEPGLWQKVRPYVAPTVEALGGALGGLGGAAAGTLAVPGIGTTLGAVSGAGLGYGIAKELLEQADVLTGGKQPRTGAQLVTEPLTNVGTGMVMEAGGQAATTALSKGLTALKNVPYNRATKVAKTALMDDLPEVINALRSAPPGATVAEATSKIRNPAWQALVQESLERSPAGSRYLNRMAAMSDEEAANALAKLASGQTAAATRGTTEVAKQNLNKVTTPMRESALARANLGKYVADEAVAREANDLAAMVGSGGQIDPVRFAAQATGAEKALRSVGIKPLEGAPLAQRISAIAQNPQFAANDLIEGSVRQIADDIAKWTGHGGVIDVNALEAIRKNSVDAAIAKLRPGMDATSQRNAAAGVLSRVKPMIDDAIESAGGAGWRDYLTTHAKGMQKIAEKQLTGEAARLWKTDKDAFVRLVQNESPDVVEKFLGPGKYNIAKELAESTVSQLESIAARRSAQVEASSQATEGQKALTTLLRQNAFRFRLPSWMNAWGAALNKGLSELERSIGANSMRQLSIAMQDPKKAANLLESIPPEERTRILNIIADPAKLTGVELFKGPSRAQQAVTGIRSAVFNQLAPERTVENELVR
jgi:hypothetical protein